MVVYRFHKYKSTIISRPKVICFEPNIIRTHKRTSQWLGKKTKNRLNHIKSSTYSKNEICTTSLIIQMSLSSFWVMIKRKCSHTLMSRYIMSTYLIRCLLFHGSQNFIMHRAYQATKQRKCLDLFQDINMKKFTSWMFFKQTCCFNPSYKCLIGLRPKQCCHLVVYFSSMILRQVLHDKLTRIYIITKYFSVKQRTAYTSLFFHSVSRCYRLPHDNGAHVSCCQPY